MLLTITEYAGLAMDDRGNVLPMGRRKIASTGKTAAATHALNAQTTFVRIATDTAVQIDMAGGETGANSELLLAYTTEFFAVKGGTTLDIETAPAS